MGKEEIIEKLAHIKPQVFGEMMNRTSPEKLFKVHVYDRDPLDHWSLGRCVLIGDAAHAMNPFAGQGANMAIIDAFLLATLLADRIGSLSSGNVPTDILTPIWEEFEKIRKKAATQNLDQARATSGIMLGGLFKQFLLRTSVKIIPNRMMVSMMMRADQQNNEALE